MNWISVPVLMMAVICSCVSIFYLFLYLKGYERGVNLTFSLSCFSIALYDVFSFCLYNTSSVAAGAFWQRFQFSSLNLFFIFMIWFVYFFGRNKKKGIYIIFTALSALFFILDLSVVNDLTLISGSPVPKHVALGGIVNVTFYEVEPGVIFVLNYVFIMCIYLYLIYRVIQYYREGNRKTARVFFTGMIIIFFAALNDGLISESLYQFIYLFEYGFLIIILSMAYILASDFVELHLDLQALKNHLEDKVKERTIDLLISEIGSGLCIEMQNELLGVKKLRAGKGKLPDLMDRERSESIQELSRDRSIVSDFKGLIDRMLGKMMEISGAGSGCVYIAGDEGAAVPEAFIGCAPPFSARQDELAGRAIGDGKYHIEKPSLSLPVILHGRAIGACYLEKPAGKGAFTQSDAGILISFISQMADAVGTALLYRKIKEDARSEKKGAVTPGTEEKIKRAISYINENFTFDISREGLAASVEISPDYMGKAFKAYTGREIGEYVNELRIREAAARLAGTGEDIIDIAYAVGFESLRTFNRAFSRIMRTTPNKYREKNS
jgi:AraC-like DNA-binding protein